MRRPHSPRAPLLAAAKTRELFLLFLSGAQEGGRVRGTFGLRNSEMVPFTFFFDFILKTAGTFAGCESGGIIFSANTIRFPLTCL